MGGYIFIFSVIFQELWYGLWKKHCKSESRCVAEFTYLKRAVPCLTEIGTGF